LVLEEEKKTKAGDYLKYKVRVTFLFKSRGSIMENKQKTIYEGLKGKYSIFGVALDEKAKKETVKQYQAAIDLLSHELKALNRNAKDYKITAYLRGSATNGQNFRPGIYDHDLITYSSASQKKLAESTYRRKTNELPSDLDVRIELNRKDDSNYSIFGKLEDALEAVARKIFCKTGILVEIIYKGDYLPARSLKEFENGKLESMISTIDKKHI